MGDEIPTQPKKSLAPTSIVDHPCSDHFTPSVIVSILVVIEQRM